MTLRFVLFKKIQQKSLMISVEFAQQRALLVSVTEIQRVYSEVSLKHQTVQRK